VASAGGGLREIVRHGETGSLGPPGDPRALAAALRALADDPATAARMGRAGGREVAARFAPERMLEELQAVYDRLAVR
jgi:glycosyltransferase involved in cell wall biosynthesis